MTGSFYELDDLGETHNVMWKNLILPSIVLGIRPLAVITQLIRNNLMRCYLKIILEQLFKGTFKKASNF